ncbi:copper resistance protein NlpE [Arenimonas donghaensis]|uniref:Copper resistance protein NlpE n=1 Tax=Arenimonas donghaensis DSM 18148 = HO3-R19 TaxID=1121014 RepID=A0A087MJR6_9GAMM|nr:copper resistance protein NlpE [Arenimonas donghaensis]KFL37119.1 hypothetical protein N788_11375 [Arenimonas donghaensis DSM 18148 = HO3-R19]
MASITIPAKWVFIFALPLALAGCGLEREDREEEAVDPALAAVVAPPSDEPFERSWQGVLPCSDCDGIRTRLTLRRDDDGNQDFELEETYLGEDAGNQFTLAGAWREGRQGTENGTATVFRLDPDGADQWYQLQPDGSLELLDGQGRPRADGIGHRLQRI